VADGQVTDFAALGRLETISALGSVEDGLLVAGAAEFDACGQFDIGHIELARRQHHRGVGGCLLDFGLPARPIGGRIGPKGAGGQNKGE
jgi:hypothetical protein